MKNSSLLLSVFFTLSILLFNLNSTAQGQLFTENNEDCPNCGDSLIAPFNINNFSPKTITVIYVDGIKKYTFDVDNNSTQRDLGKIKKCYHQHSNDSTTGVVGFKIRFNPDSLLKSINPNEYFIRILVSDSSNSPLAYSSVDLSTLPNQFNYPLSNGWQRLLHLNTFRNRWEGEFEVHVALNGANYLNMEFEVGYTLSSGQYQTQNSVRNTVIKYSKSQTVMAGHRCVSPVTWWIPSTNRFEEMAHSKELQKPLVMPNPIKNKVIIIIPSKEESVFKISIHNLQGRNVYEQYVRSATINYQNTLTIQDLNFLSKGAYILKIESSNVRFFNKLVKE